MCLCAFYFLCSVYYFAVYKSTFTDSNIHKWMSLQGYFFFNPLSKEKNVKCADLQNIVASRGESVWESLPACTGTNPKQLWCTDTHHIVILTENN